MMATARKAYFLRVAHHQQVLVTYLYTMEKKTSKFNVWTKEPMLNFATTMGFSFWLCFRKSQKINYRNTLVKSPAFIRRVMYFTSLLKDHG